MDEREIIIEDFMSWLAEEGYKLSAYNGEYGVYEIIDKKDQKEIANTYLLTTAKTKQWQKDKLINAASSDR